MTKPAPITARIARKIPFSPKVFLFSCQLENPQRMEFRPGQFVSVTVNGMRRSYSIASTPQEETYFDLLVDVAPGGPGSTFFMDKKEGDILHAIGPMGNFTLKTDEGVIVFLATGTGIAPFKSMLDTLFEKQLVTGDYQKRQIYLYYGFRFEEDMFWDDYFRQMQERHPNFHYLMTLSKPTKKWQGCSGYIQTCMDRQILYHPRAHFYVCGGNKMVQGVVSYLRENKLSDERIHFEPF